MTSHGKGLPVSWSRGGGDKVTLNRKAPLGGKVTLGRRVTLSGELAF